MLAEANSFLHRLLIHWIKLFVGFCAGFTRISMLHSAFLPPGLMLGALGMSERCWLDYQARKGLLVKVFLF